MGGVYSQREEHQEHDPYDAFMGAVEEPGPGSSDSNPWMVTLEVNGNPVKFCIDTGAEVTVISEQIHEKAGRPPPSPSNRTLRGPDTHILPVTGRFTATLKKGNLVAQEEVYVIEGLSKPLLGRPAIEG